MILMYDLDDNYLCEFKNARECADVTKEEMEKMKHEVGE